MSERDEHGGAGPEDPDQADTQSWGQSGPGQSAAPQPGAQPGGQPGGQPGPYGYGGYAGYGQPGGPQTQWLPQQQGGPSYGGGPGGPGGRARTPFWIWPVVAVTALIVGLVGGVLGGFAVSSSMSTASGGGVPAISTDNQAPAPLPADNGSVAAVAARLLPSTVQVQANGGADGQSGGGGTGSGFVIDSQGHVITNNHVVADATGQGDLKVVDQAGRSYAATIVGRSPVYDIAVLEVPAAKKITPASLGSSQNMRVGEGVVAIGSPLGLSSTVTSGIVSAIDRPVTTGSAKDSSFINAVQTDAAINPGNSGGPLVNMRGQVIGVNSAIATLGGSLGGQSGSIGVGFAIPMEQVKVTATQILATGRARYPIIGASVNTGSSTQGAQVVAVSSGSPAADSGIRKGDVVVGIDQQQVTDGIGLIVAIRSHQPGETVTLRIKRAGQERNVRVRLDAKVG